MTPKTPSDLPVPLRVALYTAGYDAARAGGPSHFNPYPYGCPQHDQWAEGWRNGQPAVKNGVSPAYFALSFRD